MKLFGIPFAFRTRNILWRLRSATSLAAVRCSGNRSGCKLNSRLIEVKNWPAEAQAANYSIALLSRRCDVSPRQLERFFLENFGQSPHHWFSQARLRRALELLQTGYSVKGTALTLGYKTVAHFSRDFKRCYGFPPSHQRVRAIQRHTA